MDALRQVLSTVQALVRRVPFYALSALSMFLGCYILNDALSLRPGQTGKLLVLLLTVNAYEALLIALALYLIRRGHLEDGRTLLLIEALFIADITLLPGECFASSLATGLAVSGVALALALVKAGFVFRSLTPPTNARSLVALAVPLVLLFATPGLFALLAHAGLMNPVTVYVAWWVAALTVVGLAFEARKRRDEPDLDPTPAVRSFRRALAYTLPASLMLHIGSAGWVHHVDFYWADLGPALLALGVARMLVAQDGVESVWQHRLPVLAILFSLGAPDVLLVHGPLGFTLSPLRAVLFAIGLVYVLAYRHHRALVLLSAASAALGPALLGHSITAMADNVGWLITSVGSGGTSLVPRTAIGWGVLAVVLAFVLLGLGAAASLWKPTEPAPPKGDDSSPTS